MLLPSCFPQWVRAVSNRGALMTMTVYIVKDFLAHDWWAFSNGEWLGRFASAELAVQKLSRERLNSVAEASFVICDRSDTWFPVRAQSLDSHEWD